MKKDLSGFIPDGTLDIPIHIQYNHCMKSKTFNISIPEELIKKVDAKAKNQYITRSGLIRMLLNNYVDEIEAWDKAFAYGHAIGKKLGIKSDEEVAEIVHDFRHSKK